MVFTNAAFKNREVSYMASNNIKSVGKIIGVKVSQKYRYWYRQYFQRIVLVSLLAILFASIVNKPVSWFLEDCLYISYRTRILLRADTVIE